MSGCDSEVAPPRCLRHSFTLHTHYEVAPPYPPFVPHVSMVCPGIAVFNTGDSLVAVGICVDSDESCCGLLTSAGDLCPMSHAASDASVDGNVDDVTVAESSYLAATPSSPFTTSSTDEQATPKDATNTPPTEPRVFRERNPSSGKENQLVFPVSVGSTDSRDGCAYNTLSSSTSVHECNECCEFDTDTGVGPRTTRLTSAGVKRTNSFPSSQPTCDTLDSTNVSQSLDETDLERSAMFELPWLTVVPPRLFDSGAGLNVGMYRASNSSCSSLSSPVILQNDTQCFTYSVRHYSSTVSHADTAEGNHLLTYSLSDSARCHYGVIIIIVIITIIISFVELHI